MSDMMRMDGFLVATGAAKSRSDAKKLLKKKVVWVGETLVTAPEYKVDTAVDTVTCNGKPLCYRRYRYFLLNKPAGVITANFDKEAKTVMELLPFLNPEEYSPVGRLDKDTEGLLLITNDGALAHRLLSPKKHVPKTYYARISGRVTVEGKARLEGGIEFSDFTSAPAQYAELSYDEEAQEAEVHLTITEGKFHQVKRMFAAIGNEVLYLRRISMGGLRLPEDLPLGEAIELEESELMAQLRECESDI